MKRTNEFSGTSPVVPHQGERSEYTSVFQCFVWLDLVLPWIILIWLIIRY